VSVFYALSHNRVKHPLAPSRPYVFLPIRILFSWAAAGGISAKFGIGGFCENLWRKSTFG